MNAMLPPAALSPHLALDALLAEVERVDLLVQTRLHAVQARADDRQDIQSMLLDADQVAALRAMPRGRPAWAEPAMVVTESGHDAWPLATSAHSRLHLLCERFGLDTIERDVLLLAALPLLDVRYGILLSYLHGDPAQQSVSMALAVQILGDTPLARLHLQIHLSPRSALLRHGLVSAVPGKKGAGEHWLHAGLHADPAIFRYLLGHDELSPELAICARWLEAPVTPAPFDGPWSARLVQVVAHQPSPLVFLRGRVGARALAVAQAAGGAGKRVLALNLGRLPEDNEQAAALIRQAGREVRLHDGWLALRGVHALQEQRTAVWAHLTQVLAEDALPVIFLVGQDEPMLWLGNRPQQIIEMPARSLQADEALLRARLDHVATEGTLDLAALVRRFQVSAATLEPLLAEADLYRSQRGADARLAQADLNAAMRLRAQQHFGKLAQRVEPRRTLADLIIAEPVRVQLDEILAAIRQREQVLAAGFDRKLSYGFGISALFHGDSGTGKTMVAECLAQALGVDLIKIDLSTVVNKYIGETEKNLARVFDLAAADAGVLFFDEADALFGKRSEVKDAQDRHANVEVSYLLQRLESYPGLVILSTNNRSHLDSAFSRRITFITQFAFPDVALRERMWRAIWPDGVTLAGDIDFAGLARKVEISGASIRNVALLATWLARDAGRDVGKVDIELALRRELSKVGRVIC